MNKKGAELTIGTIVIIVLALVVLVVLVIGFTTGWSNLWDKVIGFGGGKVNVQSVVQSCQVACSTGGTYNYCTLERGVVFDKVDGKTNPKSKDYTCKDLESETTAGLETCEDITCPVKP